MTLDERLVDTVFDVKPWTLVANDYWMAQAYIRPSDERPTSIRVQPGNWNAVLTNGAPVIHKGMVTYFRVEVCREMQRAYDEWKEAQT